MSLKSELCPPFSLFGHCSSNSPQEYSTRTGSPSPLMYAYHDTEYLGTGHGLAGILQMLLSVPGYLQHCSQSAALRASVDWLLSLQTPAGNFPCATDELGPRYNGG